MKNLWTRIQLLWWELFYGDRTILFRKTNRSADSGTGEYPEYVFRTSDPFWQRTDYWDEEHWTIQSDDGATLTLIRPKPKLVSELQKVVPLEHEDEEPWTVVGDDGEETIITPIKTLPPLKLDEVKDRSGMTDFVSSFQRTVLNDWAKSDDKKLYAALHGGDDNAGTESAGDRVQGPRT